VDEVRPALFVIDLGLPGLSGFELIERLRALPAYARAPMAVLSASDLSTEDRARLARLVQAIVQKGDSTRTGFFRKLATMSVQARPRILVIDDSEMNRRVIRAILERAACEVIEVADAASGIRAAHEEAPTVILMDIQMPEMDGLTATRHLKADPRTSAIPVIAVTAHAMAGDAERALAAGCIAYVSKPISRARLNDAIDLAMGGAEWRM
jgi:two-component system, cell cycle response regulator DivK